MVTSLSVLTLITYPTCISPKEKNATFKMFIFWGNLRKFLQIFTEVLPQFYHHHHQIRYKLSIVSLIILFTTIFSFRIVSSCPLSLPSPLSPIQLEYHDGNHDNYHPAQLNQHLTKTARNSIASPPSSSRSSLLTTILFKVVIFLMKSFMGDQWFLSKDVAYRRLDELKTSLFNYYATKNLFGVTVETARDDGIGFPSLEGALLSLAFLTFSVFLIDLIQLLLGKLRLKTATTVAPAAFLGRTFNLSPTLKTISTIPYNHNINFTNYPVSMEMLTTLSSKVLSAIEKPWRYA